jgi:ariadne-1
MEEMQITSDLTWIEVQFMKKAVDEVDKCRMTLKWTYAMAYYLGAGNEKELFEDNQRYFPFPPISFGSASDMDI